MRLLTAHLENFRSAADLTVDFSQDGVHGLVGPPGAGKSSIIAGLVFSLYGNPGPDQDLVDLRFDNAADGAPVVADYTWTHHGATYRTRRELRRGQRAGKPIERTSAQMWIDGTEVDSMSPTELTKEVTTILGMSERSFTGSILIRQGEVDTLTTAAPGAVQQMVEDQTGIGDITKLRDTTRKQATQAREVSEAMPGSLDVVQLKQDELRIAEDEAAVAVETAEHSKLAVRDARNSWDRARDKADTLRAQAAAAHEARERIASATGALTAAQETTASTAERLAQKQLPANCDESDLGNRLGDLAAKRRRLANAGNEVHYAHQESQSAATTAQTARTRAEQAAAQHAELESEAADIDAEISDLAEGITASEADMRAARALIAQLRDSITALADAHAQCPTCGQGLDEPATLVATLERQLSSTTETATEAAALTARRRQRSAALKERQHHVTGALTNITARNAEAAEAELRQHNATQRLDAAISHCANIIDCPSTDVAGVLAAVRKHLNVIDTELETVGEQKAAVTAHAEAQQQLDRCRRRLKEATSHAAEPPNAGNIDAAVADEAACRRRLDELATTSTEHAERAHTANVTVAALCAAADTAAAEWERKQGATRNWEIAATTAELLAAYRQDLIADYCHGISEAATELLELFGGEHVAFHLDADFVPRVEMADGRLRKTASLSGGEKARVGLAFRLGISMQITSGGMPSQIFADEVTQYLDEDSRQQVMATISQLFACPIVVSHTSEIFDHATQLHTLARSPLGASELATPS